MPRTRITTAPLVSSTPSGANCGDAGKELFTVSIGLPRTPTHQPCQAGLKERKNRFKCKSGSHRKRPPRPSGGSLWNSPLCTAQRKRPRASRQISKVKLQRQLHRSISARARDSPKVRRVIHRGTGRSPGRMIGQVVRLGAELDPHSLHRAE